MSSSSLFRSRCVSDPSGAHRKVPPWRTLRKAPAVGGLAILGLLVAWSAAPGALQGGSASAQAAASTGAGSPGGCVAPAAWFPHSRTPKPNPSQPFNSFCAFHQWAWQSFLWLTQQPNGGKQLRFQAFPTVQDVITGQDSSASRGTMRLKVRTQKTHGPNTPLDEINQADPVPGVLVDHGGRAGYYSQYVNPQMFQQIIRLHWNDPAVLNSIPPATEFKTGDVELKALWKVVQPGENIKNYYTQQALVDRLVTGPNGNIRVDPSFPPLKVRVVLAGLHVTGWVKGHPEAVWATFEQRNNAPDLAPNQSPSAPVSNHNWTYYSAGTNALGCNQVNTTSLALDPKTQTLQPITQVCRQYPSGMAAGTASTDPNLQAITTLNASVQRQLGGDVARNYFEVGAIWITPGLNGNVVLQPNSTLQDNLTGSTLLNNSVIETFTQNLSGSNNCFGCHNTLQYQPSNPSIQPLQGTNINLSHVILEAYVANQNKGRVKP